MDAIMFVFDREQDAQFICLRRNGTNNISTLNQRLSPRTTEKAYRGFEISLPNNLALKVHAYQSHGIG